MEMPWPHNFCVCVCVGVCVCVPKDGSQVRVLQRAIDLPLANIYTISYCGNEHHDNNEEHSEVD